MASQVKHNKSKGEKTLLTALLLSAPGPLVTGISVVMSYSTTQIADFLRRSTELVAIFASWWIYRKLQRNPMLDTAEQTRLGQLANLCVGGAMTSTGIVMLIIAVLRLSSYEPSGNVTMGLVIAVLGLLTNSWFWFRYRALNRGESSIVLVAQQKLYQAKTYVDVCVVIALGAVALAPAHPITRYIDLLGSIVVAIYLLWNGVVSIRKKANVTMHSA